MKPPKELFYVLAAYIGFVSLIFLFSLFWCSHPGTATTQLRPAAAACCDYSDLAQLSAACSFAPAVTGAAACTAYQAGVVAMTTDEACSCREKCNCDICYCSEHVAK